MHEILLDIRDIKKIYQTDIKTIEALKGISLPIYRGEIMSLLGVNGAGKTTLSSIIASLIPASEGDIIFQGASIYKNLLNYRASLGFCPQKPNFDKKLTVAENIYYAGRCYGLSHEETQARLEKLLEQFELKQYEHNSPMILSGGYKQRLIIARSLIHNPKLLILDEPTVGLDPHIRRHLWDIIRELKNQGVTIIITTHYLDEAEVLSDRVCILDKGLIRTIDNPANLKSAFNKGTLEDVFLALMEEN